MQQSLRNFSVPRNRCFFIVGKTLRESFCTRKISHNFHLLMINIHLSWSRSAHTQRREGWWMKAWKFSMEFYLLWLNENKLDFLMIHSQCTNSSFFSLRRRKILISLFFPFSWKLQSLFLIKSLLMRNHLSTYTIFVSAKFMRPLLKRNVLDCVTSGYEF